MNFEQGSILWPWCKQKQFINSKKKSQDLEILNTLKAVIMYKYLNFFTLLIFFLVLLVLSRSGQIFTQTWSTFHPCNSLLAVLKEKRKRSVYCFNTLNLQLIRTKICCSHFKLTSSFLLPLL